MTKKSRSAKSKHHRQAVTKIQQNLASTSSNLTTNNRQQPPKNNIATTQSNNTQYQYLIHELRYIGILAGAIVLILIILSYILG